MTNWNHSLLTDVHELLMLNCLCDWIAGICLNRSCSLLLEVIFPNRIFHLDQTTSDHILVPRVVFLGLCRAVWFGQEYLHLGINHHEERIFGFQLQLSEVRSQRSMWNTSIHLHFHTCVNIHHKNHTLVWSIYSHDCLVI